MCLKENPLSKFENRIFKSICDVGGKAMSHATAYAEQSVFNFNVDDLYNNIKLFIAQFGDEK